jgi:hypothetical protein
MRYRIVDRTSQAAAEPPVPYLAGPIGAIECAKHDCHLDRCRPNSLEDNIAAMA